MEKALLVFVALAAVVSARPDPTLVYSVANPTLTYASAQQPVVYSQPTNVVAAQQPLVYAQPNVVSAQQPLVYAQPNLISAQQPVIYSQPNIISGQQPVVYTQPIVEQPTLVAAAKSAPMMKAGEEEEKEDEAKTKAVKVRGPVVYSGPVEQPIVPSAAPVVSQPVVYTGYPYAQPVSVVYKATEHGCKNSEGKTVACIGESIAPMVTPNMAKAEPLPMEANEASEKHTDDRLIAAAKAAKMYATKTRREAESEPEAKPEAKSGFFYSVETPASTAVAAPVATAPVATAQVVTPNVYAINPAMYAANPAMIYAQNPAMYSMYAQMIAQNPAMYAQMYQNPAMYAQMYANNPALYYAMMMYGNRVVYQSGGCRNNLGAEVPCALGGTFSAAASAPTPMIQPAPAQFPQAAAPVQAPAAAGASGVISVKKRDADTLYYSDTYAFKSYKPASYVASPVTSTVVASAPVATTAYISDPAVAPVATSAYVSAPVATSTYVAAPAVAPIATSPYVAAVAPIATSPYVSAVAPVATSAYVSAPAATVAVDELGCRNSAGSIVPCA